MDVCDNEYIALFGRIVSYSMYHINLRWYVQKQFWNPLKWQHGVNGSAFSMHILQGFTIELQFWTYSFRQDLYNKYSD